LNWWVRTRIDLAWRKQLTEKLHAIYFQDAVFYRQTAVRFPTNFARHLITI